MTTITRSRPVRRNVVDPASARALHATFLDFAASDASVAVPTGAEGVFCAGFDLTAAPEIDADWHDRHAVRAPEDLTDDAAGPMDPTRLGLDKPAIAVIEGPAVAGGMALALWRHLRVTAADAFMGVHCPC